MLGRTACNSISRGSAAPFWPSEHIHKHIPTHGHTYTQNIVLAIKRQAFHGRQASLRHAYPDPTFFSSLLSLLSSAPFALRSPHLLTRRLISSCLLPQENPSPPKLPGFHFLCSGCSVAEPQILAITGMVVRENGEVRGIPSVCLFPLYYALSINTLRNLTRE